MSTTLKASIIPPPTVVANPLKYYLNYNNETLARNPRWFPNGTFPHIIIGTIYRSVRHLQVCLMSHISKATYIVPLITTTQPMVDSYLLSISHVLAQMLLLLWYINEFERSARLRLRTRIVCDCKADLLGIVCVWMW